MTIINTSDASGTTVDVATVTTGTVFSDSDSGHFNDQASANPQGTSDVVANIPYAAAIPGSLPGTFTTYGLYQSSNTGASFRMPQLPGLLPSTLPFALCSYSGQENGVLSPNYVQGVGWELKVFDGRSYTYQTTIPRYESLSFNIALNDEGSGQVVIDLSDSVFQENLATGGPGSDLYNYENFWQCCYNGQPIFEFLGTTVTEVLVDAASEAQPVTIAGAGTARVLSWAETMPPGFPNVVYKLASLSDSFQIAALNPTKWNLTTAAAINAGQVYVDTQNAMGAIKGTPTDYNTAPALSAGYYDATSSALSAQIVPLNMPAQPVNLMANYSFELGLTDWDTGSSAAQSVGAQANAYNADSFDGDGWCAQVTTTGAHQGIEQTVPALLPYTYYQVNAWVKQQSNAPATPTVTLHDSTNNKSSFPATIAATVGEWNLIQAGIFTGSLANINLICSINSGTAAATFLVDTVFLYTYTPYTFNALLLSDFHNPTTNYVMMELDMYQNVPRFWARVFNNGVQTTVYLTTTYDPVQHSFWRIREYEGTFYFDTAPDGATWTNQGQLTYTWSAKHVEVAFTCWYYGGFGGSPGFTPMEVGNINITGTQTVYANGQLPATVNPGSTTNYNLSQGNGVGLVNAYLEMPNAGIWLDLYNQAQARGAISFVQPTFNGTTDSYGVPWSDQASLTISNGSDLETQFEASVVAFNGDWLMQPNFQLFAGNDGTLGTDLSSTVVFHASGQIMNHTRTRARDQIANYVVAADGTGNLQYQTSGASMSSWTHREQYVQSAQPTDNATLLQLANAALQEYQAEVSQRTLQVPPEMEGLTVFVDYHLGDWIGLQNPNLLDVDSVRVVGASISIDGTQDLVSCELTLETRIQLFVERMNVLLQKIGASADPQIIAAPGSASIVVQQSINSSATNTFTQVVGDGSTSSFYVGHALGTQNVHVSVRNNATGAYAQQVASSPGAAQYTIVANSLNQVTVVFGSAPTIAEYTVVVSR